MFSIILLILCSILALVLSFMFVLIETSLLITDDIKIRILINKCKSERVKTWLLKIIENRDSHGAGLSVAITLSSVMGSTILGGMASRTLQSGSVFIYTVVMTYLMLIFARTIPKIYARSINEFLVVKFAWLIRYTYLLSRPILVFTLIWVRILGLQSKRKNLTISELKEIVSVYRQNGIIGRHESKIFDTVFDIKNQIADNFIKKDNRMQTLDFNASLDAYKSVIKSYECKKFFVEKDDELIGVVFHRELLTARVSDRKHEPVSNFTKKALIMNGNEKLIDIIVKMEKKKISQSIIVNESQEPIGILSLKDIYLLLARGKK